MSDAEVSTLPESTDSPVPLDRFRRTANPILGVILSILTLKEVNHPNLQPHSLLALFAMFGVALCFINRPVHPRWKENIALRVVDLGLALLSLITFGYLVVQTESLFAAWWSDGVKLAERAAQETGLDIAVGVVGLLLVLEATRRAIGWTLPILALLAMLYAFCGPAMPGWLFPHGGFGLERVVSQTFLQGGVFGIALRVMFKYVFLFVIFGAFLRAVGATDFIVSFARRIFGRRPGGAAKVAVISSGLMGSLSGSAVANTVMTGTFTIPLMRSAGYSPRFAAAVEAAASSGGAMVPPVMGAGAYMMLELVSPEVTYLEIVRAALIPATLYYLTLFFIVHFHSCRIGAERNHDDPEALPTPSDAEDADSVGSQEDEPLFPFEGVVFLGSFGALIVALLLGFTAFRAVSVALVVLVVVAACHRRTRLGVRSIVEAFKRAGMEVMPLVSATACVGIIIGVSSLTGIQTKLPAAIQPLAEHSLLGALLLIMLTTLILGMGLPSTVCYLLVVIMLGPVLAKLGVVPLTAHFFIFYFSMMSMITPPVALAAYAAAAIAESDIMRTAVTAFWIALAGFTLPFMFVFEPELMLLRAPVLIEDNGYAAGLDQDQGSRPKVITARLRDRLAEEFIVLGDASRVETERPGGRWIIRDEGLSVIVQKRDGELRVTPVQGMPNLLSTALAVVFTLAGLIAYAAAMTGFLFVLLTVRLRVALFVAAALILVPISQGSLGGFPVLDLLGVLVLFGVTILTWRARRNAGASAEPDAEVG